MRVKEEQSDELVFIKAKDLNSLSERLQVNSLQHFWVHLSKVLVHVHDNAFFVPVPL